MEKEFNPVIKAVQSLRKIALEIKSTNKVIFDNSQEIKKKIAEGGKLIAATNNSMAVNVWLREKAKLMENDDALFKILENIEEKFRNKDTTELVKTWETHTYHKGLVLDGLIELETSGTKILDGESLAKWKDIWKDISTSLGNILSIVETYKLKLKMMEVLKPEEIDELTMDILKHIPVNYSDEDVTKYEKEYLKAYNEIKESQSKKKNIWDKLMDVLAGGIEETPAHRVQMRRWMDGDEA